MKFEREEINEIFKNKFFEGFNASDNNIFEYFRLEKRFYNEDKKIIIRGEEANTVFLILKGEVDIYLTNKKGKDFKIFTRKSGEFVGESVLLPRKVRNSTVIVKAGSVLAVIDKISAIQMISRFPQLKDNILKTIMERYHQSDERAVSEIEKYNLLFDMNCRILEQKGELERINETLTLTVMELKKTQEELEIKNQKNLELERRNSVLAMAITANHEINQPLMVISGNAELLQNYSADHPNKEKIEKVCVRINKAVKRISKILHKFKKISDFKMVNYSDSTQMVQINDEHPDHEES